MSGIHMPVESFRLAQVSVILGTKHDRHHSSPQRLRENLTFLCIATLLVPGRTLFHLGAGVCVCARTHACVRVHVCRG